MTKFFNGYQEARLRENALEQKILAAKLSQPICIHAVVFTEDDGSMLYTRLKAEAAERVGIIYQSEQFSLKDPIAVVLDAVRVANLDQKVTGLIIQKPNRRVFSQYATSEYNEWWQTLVSAIDQAKDVDGLHPETLKTGKILPATCRAVLSILAEALGGTPEQLQHTGKKIAIIGRSDLLGRPLALELTRQKADVALLGKKDLEERKTASISLLDFDVVISATGVANLITPDLVREGVIAIDVGEPQPDIARAVAEKASFFTPVPGGVGPMTVVSLLENGLQLACAILPPQ